MSIENKLQESLIYNSMDKNEEEAREEKSTKKRWSIILDVLVVIIVFASMVILAETCMVTKVEVAVHKSSNGSDGGVHLLLQSCDEKISLFTHMIEPENICEEAVCFEVDTNCLANNAQQKDCIRDSVAFYSRNRKTPVTNSLFCYTYIDMNEGEKLGALLDLLDPLLF